jgi:hypothetical protein
VKSLLVLVMLTGFLMPAYGQQQLCFSNNCPLTPATSFVLRGTDKQPTSFFRPLPSLPAYTPVAPLALSPSTRQFFLYSSPTNNGSAFALTTPGIATATSGSHYRGMIGSDLSTRSGSSPIRGPAASSRGGVLTPGSPRL